MPIPVLVLVSVPVPVLVPVRSFLSSVFGSQLGTLQVRRNKTLQTELECLHACVTPSRSNDVACEKEVLAV